MTDASNKLPALLTTVAADFLSAFGIPGGSTLGVAVQALSEKRQRQAQEILLEELKRGDKTLADISEVEEAAAIFYRYARAAVEGAARLNLRLEATSSPTSSCTTLISSHPFAAKRSS